MHVVKSNIVNPCNNDLAIVSFNRIWNWL